MSELSVISGCENVGRTNFKNLEIYQLSERFTDEVWNTVIGWNNFARNTVGKQLVRAADSIDANIAEGSGRGSFQDNRRFTRIARGSVNETQYWLRRAFMRKLLTSSQVDCLIPIIEEIAPRLNAYINSISPQNN